MVFQPKSRLLYHESEWNAAFFSSPLPLLLIFTALFTFLIQSGELGTADTTYRLQVTHSLWTGDPQVFPNQYPEFGLHGRGGHIYAWFGIGQSLLMLPADLVGSALKHLPLWSNYVDTQADPAIRMHRGEHEHKHSVECADSVCRLSFSRVAWIFCAGEDCRGAEPVAGNDAPALRAEYAGEQLHLFASTDRFLHCNCTGSKRATGGDCSGVRLFWD